MSCDCHELLHRSLLFPVWTSFLFSYTSNYPQIGAQLIVDSDTSFVARGVIGTGQQCHSLPDSLFSFVLLSNKMMTWSSCSFSCNAALYFLYHLRYYCFSMADHHIGFKDIPFCWITFFVWEKSPKCTTNKISKNKIKTIICNMQ